MKKAGGSSLLIIIILISTTFFIYGEGFFTKSQSYIYEEQAREIRITTSKEGGDIINFKNSGTCSVFIRAYVFAYIEGETDKERIYTPIKYESIDIQYNDSSLWMEGEDGYLYYLGIINKDIDKIELVDSFTFD